MCAGDYPSFFTTAQKIEKKLTVLCEELGIEAVYRCDAKWVSEHSVLLEATRDTARLGKGEFLVVNLP